MAAFHYPPVGAHLQRAGCYLTSAGALTYRSGEAYPVEGHRKGFAFDWSKGRTIPDFAMVMILEGEGECEFRPGFTETMQSGDLLYLVPGRWHRYRPNHATGWREKWCCLSGSIVHGFVAAGWLPGECRRVPGGLLHQEEHRLDRLIGDVARDPDSNHPAWGMRALAILLQCLGQTMAKPAPAHPDPVIGAAIAFVENNLHRAVGVNDIAEFCRVERRTLERRFRVGGFGPVGQYLVTARIQRAESLLMDSSLSVKEIAFACGFGNAGRMIYDFRQHRGITPGRLRAV
jgi:AraC-like DNA-binding protein